jgi:biotin carboxyl carrier protein
MKRYRVTVEGRTYDVEVEDARARPVVARVEGDTFLVDVESGATRDAANAASSSTAPPPVVPAPILTGPPPPGQAAGDRILTAPIPGTVVKVAVIVGNVVRRGDEILTIEAMKMFNLIRSPRAGTIAAIHVAERARVSQGDPLVTFVS